MQRIIFGIVTVIVFLGAFAFLWISNPLYAFVGGIVSLVFMLVGLAFLFNLPERGVSAEEADSFKPRRTGEYRRIESVEKPEDSWEQPGSSGNNARHRAEQKTAQPDPEPVLSPRASQELFPVPPPPDASAPPEPELEPDFGNIPAMPSPQPVSKKEEDTRRIDTATFFSIGVDEAEDEEVLDLDISGEIVEKKTDTFTDGIKQKMEDDVSDDSAEDDDGTPLDETHFTAYYPRQASAGTEYGFYVYAHVPDALIDADIQQFESDLGGRVPKPVVAPDSAKLRAGTRLTAMIHCDKLAFNQVGVMQRWKAPFVRFDFKFTADDSLVDDFTEGRVAIMLGIIEIASIDFQIAVSPPSQVAMVTSIPHDPLIAGNFDSTTPVSMYQKIFISYSRKDTAVAEQYRTAQMMAGNIIFMDTHSIRAGQDWELALKQFIDSADVFQLFWSENSATSDHVKFEWDYALTQRCPETRCVQFIRPAYWEKPLVAIPPELGHLHFAFVELEQG